MTKTVTVNIYNNCGCPGGSQGRSSGGGDDIIDGTWTEIPPLDSDDGPPAGYLAPTSVTDRQCRVAIFVYWWIYYLTDKLANTSAGNSYLNYANSSALTSLTGFVIAKLLAPVIAAAAAAIVTGGINIDDAAVLPVAFWISSQLIDKLTEFIADNNITVTKLDDIFTKLDGVKDQLICVLSKGTTDNVKEDLAALLVDPVFDLSESQQEYIVLVAGFFAKTLYYTPEWWPSFDTETLSSITANCCGSFINGTPLLPASVEGCQTSWYIIDKLVMTFNGVQKYWNEVYYRGNWNPFDDDTAEYLDMVSREIDDYLPHKVVQRASDKPGFYYAVAQYLAHQSNLLNGIPIFDHNWTNLAAELSAQAATIRTNLQAALDVNDVYEAIKNPLYAWLDNPDPNTGVSDADLNTYMKNAINALIKPTGSTEDYLNMMFYQDADLATYAESDCAGSVNPLTYSPSGQCGIDTGVGTYNFANGQYDWTVSGHLCNPVYDPALGEFRGSTWSPGRGSMSVTQDASHSVQAMRVHLRGPVNGFADLSAGLVGNTMRSTRVNLDSSGDGYVTFADLCVTGRLFVSGMAYNAQDYNDNFLAITKIEFYQ